MWCLAKCDGHEWIDAAQSYCCIVSQLECDTAVINHNNSTVDAQRSLDGERSEVRKVKVVSSGEFEFHGLAGEVNFEMRHISSEDREKEDTLRTGLAMEFPEMFQVQSLNFEPRLQSSNFEV